MRPVLRPSPLNSRMCQLVSCFVLLGLSLLIKLQLVTHIVRQGRCTLVATIQMYKILALNCLITAYSLSVQYLDGIKFGDYQVTITGMLMSVCFLCISRAKVCGNCFSWSRFYVWHCVISACWAALARTSSWEHLQSLCPVFRSPTICFAYHVLGVYH